MATAHSDILIRDARLEDAAAMLAIYAPVVEETSISFEIVAPSLAEFEERVRKSGTAWAWLVAERHGVVIGYAYGSLHRERAAYETSTDVSAYVAAGARGQGVGRQLYEALLPRLAGLGYCMAFAGITLPNEASVALHRCVGFEPVGVFPRAGRKFGAWRDVAWFHRKLRDEPLAP